MRADPSSGEVAGVGHTTQPSQLGLCDRYRFLVPPNPNCSYNRTRKIVLVVRTFDT